MYVIVSVGSWDCYCVEVDIGGLFNVVGIVCSWFVVVYEDCYFFYDYVK